MRLRPEMYGKNRDGDKVGPMVCDNRVGWEGCFTAGGETFRADGFWISPETPSPHDIIAEWDCRLLDFDPPLKPGEWVQCVTAARGHVVPGVLFPADLWVVGHSYEVYYERMVQCVGGRYAMTHPTATFIRCEAPEAIIAEVGCKLQDFDPPLVVGEWVECVTSTNSTPKVGAKYQFAFKHGITAIWTGDVFWGRGSANFIRCESPAESHNAAPVAPPRTSAADVLDIVKKIGAVGIVRSIRDGRLIPIADLDDDTPESLAEGVLTVKPLAALNAPSWSTDRPWHPIPPAGFANCEVRYGPDAKPVAWRDVE